MGRRHRPRVGSWQRRSTEAAVMGEYRNKGREGSRHVAQSPMTTVSIEMGKARVGREVRRRLLLHFEGLSP